MNINVTSANQEAPAEESVLSASASAIALLHTNYLPMVVTVRPPSPTCVAADDMMKKPPLALASYAGTHLPHHYYYYPASGGGRPISTMPALHHHQLLLFQQPYAPHVPPCAVYEAVPPQEPSTADLPYEDYCEYDEDASQVFSHSCFADDQREPDFDCPLQECIEEYVAFKTKRGKELFIAHVPFDMSEEELKILCQQYGVVASAYIKRFDADDMKMSNGVAYVKFEQQIDADNALLQLNHYEVRGEHLYVDYAKTNSHGRSLSDDGEYQANRERAASASF